MKISKFNVGAEIISILTEGMYPKLSDAVNSTDVDIKVRQNSVVVQDNGNRMGHVSLRKAVRIGVSYKKTEKDIGFMGIGICSSLPLCYTYLIFTTKKADSPNLQHIRTIGNENKKKHTSY